MADIFISYSKKHAQLTEDLARDLEAAGYSTWWDTSLLPGDNFPDEIRREIEAARAVIVIWSESAVTSKWVQAEAALADEKNKLITVCDPALNLSKIPLPYNMRHTVHVTDRAKIFEALRRMQIAPGLPARNNRTPANLDDAIKALGKEVDRRFEVPPKTPTIEKPAIPPRREPQKEPDPTIRYVVAIVAVVAAVVLFRSRGGVADFKDCENCPRMVVIPSGSFVMGSPSDEPGREKWEGPQHKVTISKSFAVGKFAVTFAEWDACVAAGGCGGYMPDDQGWGRGERPVINVSWQNAKAYVAWLSKTSGAPYRLLSEAEREYVARAGTATPFWWGSSITPEQANFGEKRQRTLPVESFEPNKWGLYQVHGNVHEWVEDCWHDTYDGAPIDGSPWIRKECNARVLRGGNWFSLSQWLRAAWRGSHDPKNSNALIGFRVARTL